MSYDKRTALPENYNFIITDPSNGNKFPVTIEKEIGRGGSCIAYRSTRKLTINDEPLERNVIIKEFYPKEFETSVSRKSKQDPDFDISEDKQSDFNFRLDIFSKGLAKHVGFANEHSDYALPAVALTGIAHNTFYGVYDLVNGTTLDRNGIRVFSHIRTLFQTIPRYLCSC